MAHWLSPACVFISYSVDAKSVMFYASRLFLFFAVRSHGFVNFSL
ncbi:MAG: hypothetical protein NVSMB28_30630 [Collimonas sp.]